ncbi:hypothetical protein CPC735_064720 [Coccidioides posadasii C735 delta SOWgp]|uniref:Glycosyl transferase CAP10 domain-containing protein n=1 Tax=Coccidioides posadasii (strain C735) TaxID=222929 RepID=C5PBP5_COCP7|nr:hypothetical protein CPC735_064720 [Coccidioides posadasii C735 delta SOWgp]EER25372.1 hypothetical protein CPC735_064720 [Coccidioides posadasii C735 delta SOWgp]|eukprot:XP_003067517.1 hypothetical protein CPC735_064720 [Coccidioides posadasii C735 delta SOWgp]
MTVPFPSRRIYRISCLIITPCLVAIIGMGIFGLWFGMNSDGDNVHPLLTQLIPAGHCTCKASTTFNCTSCVDLITPTTFETASPSLSPSPPAWTFVYGRDDRNVGLTRSQCQSSFPGLFEDVHRAVRFWASRDGIQKESLDGIKLRGGMARAMIFNGNLYVIETRAAQEDHRRKILGVLSSIHRALQDNVPDIEFIFSIEDRVDDVSGTGQPLWVLGRKASEESVWLIPDFGFWAWGNPSSNIGPYDQVVETIERIDSEDRMPWSSKTQKLLWRGKLSFSPKLRRGLLEAARNKPWGDVKELVWKKKDNFISMQNHCKYMFVAHVEGRAFSSSLKYRQACRSVIVAHKLQYIQHHHYLLQSDGPHQNFVEVERDFSDLSEKMSELLANPEMARKIADNSVKTFRQRYLTRAAEACYWRELWEGWASASRGNPMPDELPDERGLRYESFLLLESSDMMAFSYKP